MGRPRGHYNYDTRLVSGKRGQLLFGNGCKYFPDCFNCPFDDCKATYERFITQSFAGSIDNLGKHRIVGEAKPIISFKTEGQFQGALDRLDRLYGVE